VTGHCQGCHGEGGIAPFSLESYEQAKMWSRTFEGVVQTGIMPPFLAQTTAECQPRFGYKDDLRLSADERELFERWADAPRRNVPGHLRHGPKSVGSAAVMSPGAC
jgi:hypothetical protein